MGYRMEKMRMAMLTALATMTAATATAQSQEQAAAKGNNEISLGLNLLTHGEKRNGGLSRDEDNTQDEANFIMGRLRLNAGYRRKGLEMKFTGQNLATWGSRGNTTFAVYEAWAKLNTRQGLFAQVGRQALAYDDERIIGPNDWAMASRSHDVLRLGYEGTHHKVHAILAYNQNSENANGGSYYSEGAQPYKTMQTLWYHYDAKSLPLGASLLLMNTGMQAGRKGDDEHTEYQLLWGAYAKYAPKILTAEASYYRQSGHNEEGSEIRAWMASAKVTATPASVCTVEAGFDYLSGDDYMAVPKPGMIGLTQHTVIKGFNPIYGSHHKFYGAMDFFYVSTYVNGFTPGLQNAYAGTTVRPVKGLALTARYHYLATATKLEDMNMTLGHEIELEGAYQIAPDIKLSAGFSYMTGTETMEKLKRASGDGSLRWAWFSLVVAPKTFTTRF